MNKHNKGDRVRCRDTSDKGVVIGTRGDLPIVRFENGAEGACSNSEKVKK